MIKKISEIENLYDKVITAGTKLTPEDEKEIGMLAGSIWSGCAHDDPYGQLNIEGAIDTISDSIELNRSKYKDISYDDLKRILMKNSNPRWW